MRFPVDTRNAKGYGSSMKIKPAKNARYMHAAEFAMRAGIDPVLAYDEYAVRRACNANALTCFRRAQRFVTEYRAGSLPVDLVEVRA